MPLERRRKTIAIVILLAGFASALVIYVNATTAPANPLGYDPEDTKQFVREMEFYGGKANVVSSEFRQWFDSLWHGKRLAFTVCVLTVCAVLFYLFASIPLPPRTNASPPRDQLPNR